MNFLHTFEPTPILIQLGSLKIHYYGLFIIIGMLLAIFIAMKLGEKYGVKKEKVIDLSFYLVIAGIIGTRLYHVFLELPYYLENPLNIFKVWNGGLAIHGGIIAGVITVYLFAKKNNFNFWMLASIIVPGLSLALGLGRWGNYFNQELFGLPTTLPWGIPINLMNRPLEYISSDYFHPTFIYESIGSFIIFLILISLHIWVIKKNKLITNYYLLITCLYLILYSVLRFSLEFIRIDRTPTVIGLRWPQIASLAIILACLAVLIIYKKKQKTQA